MPSPPSPRVSEKDATPPPEDDTLRFESNPLRQHATHPPAEADRALRVDHAVPREVGGAPAERAAHRASGSGESEQRRDLSVWRDPAARDAPNELPHRPAERHAADGPAWGSVTRAERPPR